MLEIRPAQEEDLQAITEIYNQAVIKTTATFDLRPRTVAEQKRWFNQHDDRFPILVGTVDGLVVGWASLSKFSDRGAYADTAKLSIYVHEDHRGQGHGKKLLEAIVAAGKQSGLHTVIAQIVGDNKVSLHLHREMGFTYVGTMKEVGKKFGQLLDVVIMQLIYSGDE